MKKRYKFTENGVLKFKDIETPEQEKALFEKYGHLNPVLASDNSENASNPTIDNSVEKNKVDQEIVQSQANQAIAKSVTEKSPRKGKRENPDGSHSTHLMRREKVDGKWVVFPSLFQEEDGSWKDMSKEDGWSNIYKEAKNRGEVYEFGDDEQAAISFADEGSWKSNFFENQPLSDIKGGPLVEAGKKKWKEYEDIVKIKEEGGELTPIQQHIYSNPPHHINFADKDFGNLTLHQMEHAVELSNNIAKLSPEQQEEVDNDSSSDIDDWWQYVNYDIKNDPEAKGLDIPAITELEGEKLEEETGIETILSYKDWKENYDKEYRAKLYGTDDETKWPVKTKLFNYDLLDSENAEKVGYEYDSSDATYQVYKSEAKGRGAVDPKVGVGPGSRKGRLIKEKYDKYKNINKIKDKAAENLLKEYNKSNPSDEIKQFDENGVETDEYKEWLLKSENELKEEAVSIRKKELEDKLYYKNFAQYARTDGNFAEDLYSSIYSSEFATQNLDIQARAGKEELDEAKDDLINKQQMLSIAFEQNGDGWNDYSSVGESLGVISTKLEDLNLKAEEAISDIKPQLDAYKNEMAAIQKEMEQVISIGENATTQAEWNNANRRFKILKNNLETAEKNHNDLIGRFNKENPNFELEQKKLIDDYNAILKKYTDGGGRTYEELTSERNALLRMHKDLSVSATDLIEDEEELMRFLDATGRDYGWAANMAMALTSSVLTAGVSLAELGHKVNPFTVIADIGENNFKQLPDWVKPMFTKGALNPFRIDSKNNREDALEWMWNLDKQIHKRMEKPIKYNEIESIGDFFRWGSNTAATQAVNTYLVFTQPQTAIYWLGAQASGSGFQEMDELEQYYSKLPEGHQMKDFKYSMLQQYATAIGGGLVESVSEYFTVGQAQFIKKMMMSNAGRRGFKDWAYRNFATRKGWYVNGYMPMEEGATETIAEFGNNLLKKYVSGDDSYKYTSVWENVDASFVSGAFMQKFVFQAPMYGKNAMLAFADTDATAELDAVSKEILEYSNKLEEGKFVLSDKMKEHYHKQIKSLIVKHSTIMQQTIDGIDKMDTAEKMELLNIDVTISNLKQSNYNLTKAQKDGDITPSELKEEQQKNNSKIAMLTALKNQTIAKANKSNNVSQIERRTKKDQKDAERIFGKPNEFIVIDSGDSNAKLKLDEFIKEETDAIDSRIKELKEKQAKKEEIEELEQDKKLAQNFSLKDLSSTHGLTGPFSGKMLINTDYAAKQGAVTVSNHEFLHKILKQTLADNPQAAVVMANALDQYLQDINMTEQVEQSEYANRLTAYQKEPNAMRAEEKIVLFMDALKRGDVKIKRSGNQRLGDAIRRTLQSTGLKGGNIQLNTAEDVYNFIADFAWSRDSIFFNKAIAKGAREGFKIGDELVKKYGGKNKVKVKDAIKKSKDADFALSEEIVNDMGLSYSQIGEFQKGQGNKLWKESSVDRAGKRTRAGHDLVMDMLRPKGSEGMFDGMILSSTSIPIPRLLQKKFLDDVYTQLSRHVKNFNPEDNNDLYGWIASQIKNKTLDVQKRPEYSPDRLSRAKDLTERTEEGALRYQVMADNDVADNFIDNIGATEVDQELTSELRQDLNLTPEMMGKVRGAVINTFKNNLPDFSSPKFKDELKKQYIVFLSDQIKTYIGPSAKHEQFLKDNREAIIKNLPMADLVSMERLQKDKIFGKPIRKLKTRDEIQRAVDNGLLPPDAMNKEQVWLYEKTTPTEKQFMDFFFPPLKHPVTGKKDNSRGERKKSMSQRLAVALAFDATMETIQDLDNKKTINQVLQHNKKDDLDNQLSIIAQQIGRSPYLKFSKDADIPNVEQIETLFNFVEQAGYENVFNNGRLRRGINLDGFDDVNIEIVDRIFNKEDGLTIENVGFITQVLQSPWVSINTKNELKTEGSLNKDHLALPSHLKEMTALINKLGENIVNILGIKDQGNMFGFTSRLLDPAAMKEVDDWRKIGKPEKDRRLLADPNARWKKDKDGKIITGAAYNALQDIIDNLSNFKSPNIPGVNPSDISIMNKMVSGVFQNAINKIKKGEQITPDLSNKIKNAGNSNIALFKHVIKEIRSLVNNGSISEVGVIQFLQSQTNLVKGLRGLSKTELMYVLSGKNPSTWFDSNGKATKSHPLYKDALSYYKNKGKGKGKNFKKLTDAEASAIALANLGWKGEHVGASANTNADLVDIIFNNNLSETELDVALDDVLDIHSQLIAPKFICDIMDDAGGRTSRDGFKRITKLLPKKYVDNIRDLDGNTFYNFMANKETNNTFKASKDAKINVGKVNISKKAHETISKYIKNNEAQGMSTFDFDETLIIDGKNFVIATDPTTGKEIKISSADWPTKGTRLAKQGFEMNFDDFVNVRGGIDGPLLQKMKNQIKKYGPKNVFVLTARPQEAAQAIDGWLKSKGVNIPFKNITGLADSRGDAKAEWMLNKFAEGYNDMYFVDDAMQNVDAVKNVLDQLDIKSKVVQAKLKFSKDGELDFDKILEQTKGIFAGKEYSSSEAKKIGAGKGKNIFKNFYVPPSAEDFKGLLYAFMGRGEEGNAHATFFKEKLLDPYAKANRDWNTYKQNMSNEYKALKKKFKNVKKIINNKVKGTPFTNDSAVRVYLWDKAGFDIPGLTEAQKEKLINQVNNNSDLKNFADGLSIISRAPDGYMPPSEFWPVESIASDLSNIVSKMGRKEFFAEWMENKNIIFSPKNLNKIEAIYGTGFRNELEKMLYRMETGRNRLTGKDSQVNMLLDWINGSVGAVMFFNMRSATLQTISMANFINMSDNNPVTAAAALANAPQFIKDFLFIFNSDMLKQRRAGLQIDVSASELTKAFNDGRSKPQAIIAYLLEKGFTPTQIADSFAIASGGATFYRNRLKTYLKQGMSEAKAKEQAWLDFQEVAEETQQSSRPDLISNQQAGPLGRLILAWQNTPMQMTRLQKKKMSDLINRRKIPGYTQFQSDMANIGGIAYYGLIQNIYFGALQTGLMFMLFGWDDDEERKEKLETRVANGALDSLLRGTGIYGAAVSTLKNVLKQWKAESEKPGWKRENMNIAQEAVNFSPPLGTKMRKIMQAVRTEEWNKGVSKELGLRIENPNLSIAANWVEALTNAPVARLLNKANNLEEALTGNHQLWQKVALTAGWSKWSVGVEDEELEKAKASVKEKKKKSNEIKREIDKAIKKEIKDNEKKKEEEAEKERKEKEGIKKIRCSAIKSNGQRCKMTVETKSKTAKCMYHKTYTEKEEKEGTDRDNDGIKEFRCTATTSSGKRCKNRTENKSKKCYAHNK